MEKIREITLFKWIEGNDKRQDIVDIGNNSALHFVSLDCGPLTDSAWGHDYEYDTCVDTEWKDTILLLLLKERFKNNAEFRKWADEKTIPHTETNG